MRREQAGLDRLLDDAAQLTIRATAVRHPAARPAPGPARAFRAQGRGDRLRGRAIHARWCGSWLRSRRSTWCARPPAGRDPHAATTWPSVWPAQLVREVPKAGKDLPSPALGQGGGGADRDGPARREGPESPGVAVRVRAAPAAARCRRPSSAAASMCASSILPNRSASASGRRCAGCSCRSSMSEPGPGRARPQRLSRSGWSTRRTRSTARPATSPVGCGTGCGRCARGWRRWRTRPPRIGRRSGWPVRRRHPHPAAPAGARRRRPPDRGRQGLCAGPRGVHPHAGQATVRRAADGCGRLVLRQAGRDADRRGQDADRRRWPPCIAGVARLPVHVVTVNDYLAERDAAGDAAAVRLLRPRRRHHRHRHVAARPRRAPMPATSPTAPTRSWCSTT